jgi:hypothetical protein
MKSKKFEKAIILKKETIANLSIYDLDKIKGGGPTFDTRASLCCPIPPDPTITCTACNPKCITILPEYCLTKMYTYCPE